MPRIPGEKGPVNLKLKGSDTLVALKHADELLLRRAFKKNLEKFRLPRGISVEASSCFCEGCSCPGGNGDICDAGTYVGYAGGYFGANLG